MMDEKYVVFKKDEFEQFLVDCGDGCRPEALEDAVVIRTQDVYAGPALHAYAGAVLSAAEMREGDSVRDDLVRIADYFHDRAVEADDARRTNRASVPD